MGSPSWFEKESGGQGRDSGKSTRDILYGPKGSPKHGHHVSDAQTGETLYHRTPGGGLVFDRGSIRINGKDTRNDR